MTQYIIKTLPKYALIATVLTAVGCDECYGGVFEADRLGGASCKNADVTTKVEGGKVYAVCTCPRKDAEK